MEIPLFCILDNPENFVCTIGDDATLLAANWIPSTQKMKMLLNCNKIKRSQTIRAFHQNDLSKRYIQTKNLWVFYNLSLPACAN